MYPLASTMLEMPNANAVRHRMSLRIIHLVRNQNFPRK